MPGLDERVVSCSFSAFYSVLLEFAGLSPVITELVQDRVLLLLLEDLFALTNGVSVPF